MSKLQYPEVIEQYIAQEKSMNREVLKIVPMELKTSSCICYEVTSVDLISVTVWKYYFHHGKHEADFTESATIYRDDMKLIYNRMNELMQEALEKDKEELEKTA